MRFPIVRRSMITLRARLIALGLLLLTVFLMGRWSVAPPPPVVPLPTHPGAAPSVPTWQERLAAGSAPMLPTATQRAQQAPAGSCATDGEVWSSGWTSMLAFGTQFAHHIPWGQGATLAIEAYNHSAEPWSTDVQVLGLALPNTCTAFSPADVVTLAPGQWHARTCLLGIAEILPGEKYETALTFSAHVWPPTRPYYRTGGAWTPHPDETEIAPRAVWWRLSLCQRPTVNSPAPQGPPVPNPGFPPTGLAENRRDALPVAREDTRLPTVGYQPPRESVGPMAPVQGLRELPTTFR